MSATLTPCRKAFTKRLHELAGDNEDVFVVTSDARGSVTLVDFAEDYPNQFVEVGIAEQNEVGVAAGLSTFGKQVIVCAPACFLSARSLEQIKLDVIYSATNVKIVGVSGGVSYGALGYSHHSLHDVAVMRTLPNMAVILPADPTQMRAITDWMVEFDGPAYIRMGRGGVPAVYKDEKDSFTFGKANTLRSGNDIAIIASGEMVATAVEASIMLEQLGIGARVLDLHTIKPLDRDAIVGAAKETKAVLTVEEHSVFGGVGAAVSELLVQTHPVPMKIMGIPDEFTVEGSSNEVFQHYGLTPSGLVQQAVKILDQRGVA